MRLHRVVTLGCKVNQCESAAIGSLLEAAGWRCAGKNDRPDVIVVNTCTVTGRAAMQSRQAIRRAAKQFPKAQIVVTGCYAQTAAGEIRAFADSACILSQKDKLHIPDLLLGDGSGGGSPPQPFQAGDSCTFAALPPFCGRERTRAFLKVQDGCNTRCTYCIVPIARGPSRSMPPQDVRAHLERLRKAGIREVVLTGIHLGAYGIDLQPAGSLSGMVAQMVSEEAIERIRLSSIEPTEVDRPLVALMAGARTPLCRHFHIPLQSGDDHILRRMGRPYTRDRFARTIEEIHRHVPDAAIGVDVMAGFPGESETAFLNTSRLIDDLPISYLHVFPFSARPGTPAASYKDKVPPRIVSERCRALRALGAQKKAAFHRRMTGRTLNVLIETSAPAKSRGLSDNYIPVTVAGKALRPNTLVTVRIKNFADDGEVIAETLS